MQQIIQKRFKTAAENLLIGRKDGFKPGRSTVEQVFNCRILIEKRLQHQEDMLLLHRFTKGFWQSLVQVKHGDPGRHRVKDCPSRSLEDGRRHGGEKTNWLTNKCPVQDLLTLAQEQRELRSLGEAWANGRAGTTCPLSLSLDNHDIMFDLFPYMIFLRTAYTYSPESGEFGT